MEWRLYWQKPSHSLSAVIHSYSHSFVYFFSLFSSFHFNIHWVYQTVICSISHSLSFVRFIRSFSYSFIHFFMHQFMLYSRFSPIYSLCFSSRNRFQVFSQLWSLRLLLWLPCCQSPGLAPPSCDPNWSLTTLKMKSHG